MLSTLLTVLAIAAPGPPVYCPATVLRDYYAGLSYLALVRLAPSCPPGAVARVRKFSNFTSKVVEPLHGAWPLTAGETLYSWVFISKIQYFEGRDDAGNEVWRDAEVR